MGSDGIDGPMLLVGDSLVAQAVCHRAQDHDFDRSQRFALGVLTLTERALGEDLDEPGDAGDAGEPHVAQRRRRTVRDCD